MILLELLVAAVKRATGELTVRDVKVRQKEIDSALQDITKAFLKVLPSLLSKVRHQKQCMHVCRV